MKTILTLVLGLFTLVAAAQAELNAEKYLEAINCTEYTCVEKVFKPLGFSTRKSLNDYSFYKINCTNKKEDIFMFSDKFGTKSLSFATESKILFDGLLKQLLDLGFKESQGRYLSTSYSTINFSISSVDTGSGMLYMILMSRK